MMLAQAINGKLRSVPAWPIYVIGFAYGAWLFWLGLSDNLGADPVRTLEREIGRTALKLLIAGLMVTPIRKWTGVSLIKYRRALGVTAFGLVVMHLTVWLTLDIQLRWTEIGADLLKRPYITIGMAAFVILVPLAATSNNLSVRRLGAAAWQRLHKLTYIAVATAAVHYVMVVKAWPPRPIVYLAIVVVLLGLRMWWARRKLVARPA